MRESETPPVLVVDGDARVRGLVASLFQRLGFPEVDAVGDGPGALERLRARAHTLVLCEMAMEPMDGLALLRVIRGDEALTGMPVILSAEAFDGAALDAARLAGADAFILKPFDPDVLRAKARGVLNRKQPRRGAAAASSSAFALDFPLLAQA